MASTTTNKYRENVAKALAGTAPLPAIVKICVGTGGVDENKNPKTLTGSETALFNQVIEKNAAATFPTPYTTRFTAIVDADVDNLIGSNINEAALKDANGDIVAIKTFTNKGLDSGTVIEFDYDVEQ